MVYIRQKNVKGIDYAYLVQSKWDSKTKSSRQTTIKYLGRAEDVRLDDIPSEYHDDPKINKFISTYKLIHKQRDKLVSKIQSKILTLLREYNVDGLVVLYNQYSRLLGLASFFDELLKPVMYKIGDLWAKGEIDVATEHACTNAANNLIGIINKLVSSNHRITNHSTGKSNAWVRKKNKKILICTPEGELHNLACNILESLLIGKGFAVYNISPSAPAYSVLGYLRAIDPDIILISITLVENTNSAIRLVKDITKNFDKRIPIYIGGAAIAKSKIYKGVTKLDISPDISIIEDCTFKGILEIVSSSLSKTQPVTTNDFE